MLTARACGMPALPGPKLADCAIVGSSDILRLLPMGEQIDRHRSVWRLNNAPVAGFELWVGSRTDVRLVNRFIVDVWAGKLSPTELEPHRTSADDDGRGPDSRGLGRWAHSLCFNTTCWLSDTGHAEQLRQVQQRVPAINMAPLPFFAEGVARDCVKNMRGATLGYASVLIALASCQGAVHLYGFMPLCCAPEHYQRGWPAMNYKYYHTNATQSYCCVSKRERMDREFARILGLERAGHVQLHPPRADAPRTGPPWWPYDRAQLAELAKQVPAYRKDPWELALAAGRAARGSRTRVTRATARPRRKPSRKKQAREYSYGTPRTQTHAAGSAKSNAG